MFVSGRKIEVQYPCVGAGDREMKYATGPAMLKSDTAAPVDLSIELTDKFTTQAAQCPFTGGDIIIYVGGSESAPVLASCHLCGQRQVYTDADTETGVQLA